MAAPQGRFPRLLGDVGGTNARFAWQASPGVAPGEVASYACAGFKSLEDAVRHYLAQHGHAPPRRAAIGIANPITGDRVQMTNHSWSFSIDAMRRSLGLERLLFLNDFAALALALPTLQAGELRSVGAGVAVAQAPIALLGPGTGLGVSGLLGAAANGRRVVISGEGGHVTLAPADDEEAAVLACLRQQFGHVSAERALSGPGLVNLRNAWCAVQGQAAQALSAPQISEQALAQVDPSCVAALDLFLSLLGNVAGNLALTLGARGGVYIGGGIVPRLGDRIERSRFRERFEAKGRFSEYLRQIPVCVIQPGSAPALRGAAQALDEAD
jgi:glucokinase